MSSQNPELQGSEKNSEPSQNSSARATEDRNPESENPHSRTFSDAGEDSDQSKPNSEYGYLDEAINSLRATESPEERADAARTLGIVGSHQGTASLIAALFDNTPEVRIAAEEALSQIGDPSVSVGPMSTMISGDIDYGASYVVGPSEAETDSIEETEIGSPSEVATTNVHFDAGRSSLEQTIADDPDAVAEASPEFEELGQIRSNIAELERLLVAAVAARNEADKEASVRAEQESAFRAEASARRREDEEARKRAEEKAARRRSEDERKMAAEQLGRLQAELEAQRLAEEEERLRVEAGSLRQTADEMSRQRAEFEANEFALAAEARRLEAESSLRKAEEECNAELKRFRTEEEAWHRATEEATAQRIEVEAQRREAEALLRRLEGEKQQLAECMAARDAEAQLLREAEAKVRSAQEELNQQVEALLRVSEEVATRRGEIEAEKLSVAAEVEQLKEAQERIGAAERSRREAETERLQLEADLAQQLEREQRLLDEIRRRADDEQQRLEEASRLTAEEQDRRLAELEALREEIEIEAQQRAEKERRLNSEIEALRRLEKEERNRIAEISSSRAEAETRLQRERERLKLEEEALAKTESQIEFLLEPIQDGREVAEWYDDPAKNLRAVGQPAVDEAPDMVIEEFVSASEQTSVASDLSEDSESFLVELRSADPDKRMASLAGLARYGSSEAFGLITRCFDDPSPQVRNAAARALRDREPDRTVESFTRAIEEGSPERTRNIGLAISASGLAREALHNLGAESRQDTYKALSLLFIMAKTGEIQPLVQTIAEHPEPEVCSAAIKLLNLSGQSDAVEAALQRRREGGQ